MQQPSTQLNSRGLQLRLRRMHESDHRANHVEYIEEIQNTSDQPVCFALRSWERRIYQVATSRTIEGHRQFAYHPEPKDLSIDGVDYESSLRIVKGFRIGGGAADGGEILGPSGTKEEKAESFTILQAGLYRMQCEWTLHILDAREAPDYKVLAECTIQSNVLDLDVTNDIPQSQ